MRFFRPAFLLSCVVAVLVAADLYAAQDAQIGGGGTGLGSYRLADREYVVLLEDDYKSKVVMYRLKGLK